MAIILAYLANIAEIIAGIAIVFSIVKVWPVFNNLDQLVKGGAVDWSPQLTLLKSDLSKFGEQDCPDLPDTKSAVSQIILSAITSGSSDIHIEIKELDNIIQGCIRYRKDGTLQEVARYDARFHLPILSAVKELANISNDQVAIPHRGRIRFDVPDGISLDMRLQVTPSSQSEAIVLRILDPASAKMPFSKLGYTSRDLTLLEKALDSSEGLMICGGPTGSGKTVTCYTSVNSLDDQLLKIVSVEDPIEIDLPRITQHSVQDLPGNRFTELFNAAIGSDPDVLLIGELRDEETANCAIAAASSGHLVLTTMHSHSVIHSLQSLNRYTEELVLPEILIVNQRLVRRLCQICSKPYGPPSSDIELMNSILEFNNKHRNDLGNDFKTPVGCEHCNDGYKGRVGGYEVLRVTQQLVDLADQSALSSTLWKTAVENGLTTIGFDLLDKTSQGETSFAEIRRVTGFGTDTDIKPTLYNDSVLLKNSKP